MLNQAKKFYPNLSFIQDTLPDLSSIKSFSFNNIFCSAILMHLNNELLPVAIINLLRLLKNDGVLIISFRGTEENDNRENGKLYTPIEKKKLLAGLSYREANCFYLSRL
ncbi:MAG: class I SAM-dependent methyltransferase [Synechococcaceae cyanobacterium SM1_2_3]|nr:class I SAM-dependent methyltransferase [Synechococcaceae cyanobacterium SM1_2_3]